MKKTVRAVVTLATVSSIGCSVATTVQRNTDAINRSSETIGTNTQAVNDSTKATGTLIPALQGVERLKQPMESVAAAQRCGPAAHPADR